MAEELKSLAERPGWTADETVATYEPVPGGWISRVRKVRVAGHTYERWHIAVIDPRGMAQYTTFASVLSEATRVAEGSVRGRNA